MEHSIFLILLGSLFLISLVVTPVAAKLKLPRVSLFVIFGAVLGQLAGSELNGKMSEWFTTISDFTLLIIGYLLGSKITFEYLQKYAFKVGLLTLLVTFSTFIIVSIGVYLISENVILALALGAIAIATDPAATLDVIDQNSEGNNFADVLRGIVALDDAIGLIFFSVIMAILAAISNISGHDSLFITISLEILGAIGLGCLVGFSLVFLLNKHTKGKPVLVESLGLIILCGGLALYFNFSFLLASIVMGFVVVNNADESQEHLHEIEFIEQPLLVLFFILAGASLNFDSYNGLWLLLVTYIVCRILGRYLSGIITPPNYLPGNQRHWFGIALLPQAGVAMGMALMVAQTFPDHSETILSVCITATIFFEIVGPIITKLSLSNINHS